MDATRWMRLRYACGMGFPGCTTGVRGANVATMHEAIARDTTLFESRHFLRHGTQRAAHPAAVQSSTNSALAPDVTAV
ncbi:MAG TPA: hypothetical protein VGG76_01120, partial [Gemmatimonadaceae bacterium]